MVAMVVVSVIAGLWMIPDRDVDTGPDAVVLSPTGKVATLRVGGEIAQEFTAHDEQLTGVELNAGAIHSSPECALQVEILEENQSIYRGDTPCADFDRSIPSTRIAEFPAVEDSEGQRYRVIYGLVGGDQDAVAMELGTPIANPTDSATYGPGTLRPEDQESVGDAVPAAVPVYDGGSLFDQARTALDRAAVFGPWWTQPWAVVTWSVLSLVGLLGALWAALAGRVRTAGALVGLLALTRSLVWAAMIPMLNGMDEPQHLSYVQYLAEQGLPGREAGRLLEAYSPQMAELLRDSSLFGVWPTDRYDFNTAGHTLAAVAQASPMSAGRPLTAQYSPAYYALGVVFYRISPYEGIPRMFDVRLASVLLGVVCAGAVFWFFRALFQRRLLLATALSLAVTVQPMMCHQFAIVNNDALVITGSMVLMAAAMSLIRGGGGWACAVMGLGGALAVLGKPQGVLVLPVALAAVIVSAAANARRWRTFWARCAQFLGAFALFFAWWPLLQRARGLGNLLVPTRPARAGEDRSLTRYLQMQVQERGFHLRERWVNQLFGNFAWLDVWFPHTVYTALALGIMVLMLVVGLWAVWRALDRAVRLARRRGTQAPSHTGDIWLCVGIVALFLAGINAVGYVGFRADGTDTILQGRYVLPMIPALFALLPLIALNVGSAVSHGAPRRTGSADRPSASTALRWSESVAVVLSCAMLAAMVALSVLGIGSIVERFLW